MKKILSVLLLTCISLTVFGNATVAQKEWRWRQDNGSETSASWITSQDQAATGLGCTINGNIRLRIGFQVNPDAANPPGNSIKTVNWQLSYSTSATGPWTKIDGSLSNAFKYGSSQYVIDGSATTQQIIHSFSGPFVTGQILSDTNTTNITFITAASTISITDYEWVLVPTSNIQNQTYYFQLEGLDSYPVTLPSITYTGGATSSTLNIAACDSYTSPSGQYTWTTSGTYHDTIPNTAGCDSMITAVLDIKNSTTSSLSATACDSYTLNSQTYTTSGAHIQTVTNAAGCDSTITLNLTIKNSTSSTLTETACGSYTLNAQTYTASGVHVQTLTNAVGCDSTITLNLTINNPTTSTLTETACSSYTLNAITYTSSGVYTQTLTNSVGCDSTITLNLTINNPTTSTLTETACSSYTLNAITYTSSGVYTQTLTNSVGCDSTITLNLTINNPTTSTLTETACESYTLNSQIYTASGVYTQTLTNAAGCDSIITLNLTINTVDVAITNVNETISANNANGTYQWVDCNNNFAHLSGETNQSYVATANGNYAVIITENGCSDTSACTQITNIGMKETTNTLVTSLYPNPNNGTFTIDVTTMVTIEVRNAIGQLAFSSKINAGKNSMEINNLINGIYSVITIDEKGNINAQKIIVNR